MDRFIRRSNSVGKRPLEDPVDTSDWKIPKRTVHTAELRHPGPVKTTNRFTALSKDQKTANTPTSLYDGTFKTKVSRFPPIILEIPSTWTHEHMKSIIMSFSKGFHLQYRTNRRVAVICYTAEGHQAIKEGLRNKDIAFHTFSRKDEKNYKAVIFGLPDYVGDLLPNELSSLGFDNVVVRKMKVPAEKASYCPPYLVQLPPGADFSKFRQIKLLCNSVVQIRKYHSNNRYGTQCYRCQGFGHSSRNCNLPPRCVKCKESHKTEDCTKKSRDEPAECCNCGESHPANYRQCKEREKYLRITRDRQVQNKATTTNKIATKTGTTDDRPWSSIAANKPQNPGGKDQTSEDMLAILRTIKSIKDQFLSCNNMMDKVILILTYLGQYV